MYVFLRQGVAHLLVIVAGFRFPVWLSNIRTSCPGTSGGRLWAVLSWYIFCISCLCFSSSRIWSVLENLGVETLAIKFDLKMRLFKSSVGLGRLCLTGVVRKHSIAKLGSLPACLALIRALNCLDLSFNKTIWFWELCWWCDVIKLPLLGKFFECFTGVLWSIVTNNSAGNTMFREYLLHCWYDHIACCQAIHFPYNWKFTVIISNYQIFMIIAVKQICADNFLCSAGDVIWL